MRNQLPKHRYKEFEYWLLRQDVKLLEAKGEWELLKWDTGDPLRPAIVFDNLNKVHLTLNQQAEKWWEKWRYGEE